MGPPPLRPPLSIRRTASLQTYWPHGIAPDYALECRARDLFTGETGSQPVELGQEWIRLAMQPGGIAQHIAASRMDDQLAPLAGRRVGGPMRKGVAETMPQEPENSTLLYRLIDDLAGGAFLAPAGWQSWLKDGIKAYAHAVGMTSVMDVKMEGMCVTYATGSPALLPDGRQNEETANRSIGAFAGTSDDPHAWHPLLEVSGTNEARLRYMDVWRADGMVQVCFGFQDSSAFPGTDLRQLFHEYRGFAVIEPETMVLQSIRMEYGSLPYHTCPAAASSPQALVGQSVREFRKLVIATLPGTAGCTHLNDALRTLQDVPALVVMLDQRMGKG